NHARNSTSSSAERLATAFSMSSILAILDISMSSGALGDAPRRCAFVVVSSGVFWCHANGTPIATLGAATLTHPGYDAAKVAALLGRGHIAFEVHDDDPRMGEAR